MGGRSAGVDGCFDEDPHSRRSLVNEAPSSHRAPSSVRSRIDRYELLLPIARGGMGTVYLARMRGIGGFVREVALKLVHEHLEGGDAERELLSEARIAARLRHPNIVPVLDVGENDGRPFIVMDYVEGDSLAGLRRTAPKVTGERLPLAVGLRAVRDSLAGLHAAHELVGDDGASLGLVHRDFSPQNILVGVDGLARLSDFGVAKLALRDGVTRPGMVKGKTRYMSPEQAVGAKLDRRCDVWAAGVVLWELLTGKKLYSGDNDAVILLKIVSEQVPPVRAIAPDVHPALEAVVAGALEHDVERRTPTALALRQALSRAVREAGLFVEQDDVAELVTRVAGPAVSERRTRAAHSQNESGVRRSSAPEYGERDDREPTPRPERAIRDAETTTAPSTVVAIRTPNPSRRASSVPPLDRRHIVAITVLGACGAMLVIGLTLIVLVLVRERPQPVPAAAAPTVSSPR